MPAIVFFIMLFICIFGASKTNLIDKLEQSRSTPTWFGLVIILTNLSFILFLVYFIIAQSKLNQLKMVLETENSFRPRLKHSITTGLGVILILCFNVFAFLPILIHLYYAKSELKKLREVLEGTQSYTAAGNHPEMQKLEAKGLHFISI